MTTFKARAKALGLLAAITILFRWKTLLTQQFSMLTLEETVNQGYCWLAFCIHCIRHAKLPAWDPYTLAGHSFIGEMQTSGLSPFNLLLAVFPLDRYGLVRPGVYHWYIAVLIFLAAAFMYWLARDLGLDHVPALLAAVCFGMGGFLPHNQSWPDMLQSGIWLPLIFMLCRRSLEAATRRQAVANAAGCGLAMGMAVLGGRLHMVMMQSIVVAAMTAYHAWQSHRCSTAGKPASFVRAVVVVALIAAVCFGAGAVQILPSIEYSTHTWRAAGEAGFPSTTRIPYFYLNSNSGLPQSLLAFVFPFGFEGSYGMGEFINPYFGIFPLMLVCLAFLKRWRILWVRFCGLLALAAWLYALGPLSLLHGVAYATVPWLWLMRESGRMMYLASFALALLAGYGAQALLSPDEGESDSPALDRVFLGVAIGCAAMLALAGAFNIGSLNYWNKYSIAIILLSYWLYRVVLRRPQDRKLHYAIIALVLFDLAPYDWTVENLLQMSHDKREPALETLRNAKGAVDFLRLQPGVFRVAIAPDEGQNIGDAFSILTTSGRRTTVDTAYMNISSRNDLLNVRYVMKPASTADPGAEYADQFWKVYRNTDAAGPAWIVHQATQMPLAQIKTAVHDTQLNLLNSGLVEQRAPMLEPAPDAGRELVSVESYEVDRIRLRVHALSRGLLVLSEIHNNGWQASVNGGAVEILRVDGALRGVVVPAGDDLVDLRYRPASLWLGGILTALTFGGGFALIAICRRLASTRFHNSASAP
jgi:hypothetical protein